MHLSHCSSSIIFLISYFNGKVKILYTDSNQVINAINDKIVNFEKGICRLYNNEDISIDEFAKRNFEIKKNVKIKS